MPLSRILRRLLFTWAFFGVLALAALILAFVSVGQPTATPAEGQATIVLRSPSGEDIVRTVDVADDDAERRRGLQNRPTVERGMLFVFPDEAVRGFWMKDTLVPLDIAYFRSNGVWVSSAYMEPCLADPCATYPSAAPARYAVEFPAGEVVPLIGTGWLLVIGAGS